MICLRKADAVVWSRLKEHELGNITHVGPGPVSIYLYLSHQTSRNAAHPFWWASKQEASGKRRPPPSRKHRAWQRKRHASNGHSSSHTALLRPHELEHTSPLKPSRRSPWLAS